MNAFSFGGNTGNSYDDLKRKQALLSAMAMRGSRYRGIGGGLERLGTAIAHGMNRRRLAAAESEGQDAFSREFGRVITGAPAGGNIPLPNDVTVPSSDGRSALALAVQKAESANDPNAVSPKGAQGLMQVMPDTARDPGFGVAPARDGSVAENIRVGDEYLNAMVQRYNGDIDRALVAYNWGPGNADKWNGDPSTLPAETRNYITTVRQNLQSSGGAQPQPVQQRAPGINPRLVQMLSNPFASPAQKQVLGAMLQQQLAAANPKPAKPVTVDQGESLVDPRTGRVIFAADPKSDVLSDEALAQKIQLREAGRPSTNVTVGGGKYGKIPPGFQLIEDQNGVRLEPIAGGPAATEAAEAAEKAQARQTTERNRAGLISQDIDRAIALIDQGLLPTTGFGASTAANIDGTAARDIRGLTETIKANIGFSEINTMRQQSPTGGALGNVTERELAFLQSVAGNLDQSQSEQQFRDNLNRLWNAYQDVIHGPGNGPERRQLSFEQSSSNDNQPSVDDLVAKYLTVN